MGAAMLTYGGAVGLGLLFATLLLELHLSNVHDGGRDAVDVLFLLGAELQHVEGSLRRTRGQVRSNHGGEQSGVETRTRNVAETTENKSLNKGIVGRCALMCI